MGVFATGHAHFFRLHIRVCLQQHPHAHATIGGDILSVIMDHSLVSTRAWKCKVVVYVNVIYTPKVLYNSNEGIFWDIP